MGAFDDGAEDVDFDGLLAEIVGAAGDGAERVGAVPVGGGDDDAGVRGDACQAVERGETFGDAVRVRREAEIHDGDGGLLPAGEGEGGETFMGEEEVEGGEGPAVLAADPGVILDNQQLGFGHRASGLWGCV